MKRLGAHWERDVGRRRPIARLPEHRDGPEARKGGERGEILKKEEGYQELKGAIYAGPRCGHEDGVTDKYWYVFDYENGEGRESLTSASRRSPSIGEQTCLVGDSPVLDWLEGPTTPQSRRLRPYMC